jgi:hypothetical protein
MLNKIFKGNVPADPFGQAAMQTLKDDELTILHALNRLGALADAAAGNSDYLIPPHVIMSGGGAAQPDSDTSPAAGEISVCASVSHVCF